MFCSNCGAKIQEEGMEYCSNCGQLLHKEKDKSKQLKLNKRTSILLGILALLVVVVLILSLANKSTESVSENTSKELQESSMDVNTSFIKKITLYSEDGSKTDEYEIQSDVKMHLSQDVDFIRYFSNVDSNKEEAIYFPAWNEYASITFYGRDDIYHKDGKEIHAHTGYDDKYGSDGNDKIFVYDETGKLDAYITECYPSCYNYYDCKYDDNNNLIQVVSYNCHVSVETGNKEDRIMSIYEQTRQIVSEHPEFDYIIDDAGKMVILGEEYAESLIVNEVRLYEYNSEGKIANIYYYYYYDENSVILDDVYKHEFEYNNGLLTKCTIYYYIDGVVDDYVTGEYDDNNNLIGVYMYNADGSICRWTEFEYYE